MEGLGKSVWIDVENSSKLMIQFINRSDIDEVKYNACIENSLQSRIYAYSWYLDIACDNWGALILNDYEAVMPLPWRKKMFIKYVYPPFWILQLGLFSKESQDENEFLIALFSSFRFVETKMNTANAFSIFKANQIEKRTQFLSLKDEYSRISLAYKRERKKELKKAMKYDLVERWNDSPDKLIDLYKSNVGRRVKKLKDSDYLNLLKLMEVCRDKKMGELLSIYDNNQRLVASAFFITHHKRVSILVSSTDFKNRKNGANTFLIDRAIFKYQRHYNDFDFGGSSIKSIANFFKSFGSKDQGIILLKYNNLPRVLRFFKR